jgi:Uma2 family endonuclease
MVGRSPGWLNRPLTYRDLDTTPDDGNRYEVIDGELYVTPFPNVAHQDSARSDRRSDVDQPRSGRAVKLRKYASSRVPHYWIIDPDARRLRALKLAPGQLTHRAAPAARGSQRA